MEEIIILQCFFSIELKDAGQANKIKIKVQYCVLLSCHVRVSE